MPPMKARNIKYKSLFKLKLNKSLVFKSFIIFFDSKLSSSPTKVMVIWFPSKSLELKSPNAGKNISLTFFTGLPKLIPLSFSINISKLFSDIMGSDSIIPSLTNEILPREIQSGI